MQPLPASLNGPRPLHPDELTSLMEMLNFIFRTSAGRAPTVTTDWGHVYLADNLANVRVISDGDRLVGSAALWPNTVYHANIPLRIGGVNMVGVLPEYRRLGLAGHLLLALHQRMLEIACPVGLLTTDITRFYRRFGWELAGLRRTYHLHHGNIELLPQLSQYLEAMFLSAEALPLAAPELMRLRTTERLGSTRIPEAFVRQIANRGQPRAFVAYHNGTIAAYLLVSGGPDTTVIEWAGEATIVAGLLRACFAQFDDTTASTSTRDSNRRPLAFTQLKLVAPPSGHDLLNLLDQLRIPYETTYLGMLYVADPAAVLAAYGIHDIEAIEQADRITLRRGREQIELDRCRLAQLFFGPERVSNFAQDIFPLPIWQWGLDKV